MKVVVDTNVLISSFIGIGNPRKIIDLWKTGVIRLCLTQSIIDEYVDVLQRLDLINEIELEELLNLFAIGYNCDFISNTPNLRIVNKDPFDDKFFECAVAHKAKYIISGDKEVLKVGKYIDITVLNPTDFINHVI
jgi:putative PIN family toxin of toxin-antitoxin system